MLLSNMTRGVFKLNKTHLCKKVGELTTVQEQSGLFDISLYPRLPSKGVVLFLVGVVILHNPSPDCENDCKVKKLICNEKTLYPARLRTY